MTGVRKSHERMTILCTECGEEFETSYNIRNRYTVCPDCNKRIREEEKEEEAETRKGREGNDAWWWSRRNDINAYMVEFDPDESWGYKSMLTKMEVRQMLMIGNFAVGTRLRKDGKMYLVLKNMRNRAKSAQCLEEIEER